jgi:cation:H+ antiporter
MIISWIGFIICTFAIVYSGTRLSKYGDIIAEKTGVGKVWIGVILMASVTSLPELVTGVGSVTYGGVPNIAVGDVLGSCVFNILIIAILDIVYPVTPLSAKAHQGNILSAGFGILLLSIVAASLFLGNAAEPMGWIGPYTVLFVIVYLVAMRLVFFYEKRQISSFIKEIGAELRYRDISQKEAITKFSINAVVVIVAAVFLPEIGAGLAESTGLGQTFVGNILIAVSTSLPELVVSLTAIKIDAVDLAVGNLFGSNIFNIFILAIDDIFFVKGPLLSFANPSNIISALSAIAMTTIAIIGLTYRAEKKRLFLAWDSIGIVLAYVVNLMLLYMLK